MIILNNYLFHWGMVILRLEGATLRLDSRFVEAIACGKAVFTSGEARRRLSPYIGKSSVFVCMSNKRMFGLVSALLTDARMRNSDELNCSLPKRLFSLFAQNSRKSSRVCLYSETRHTYSLLEKKL